MNIPGLEGRVLLFNIGGDKLRNIMDLCRLHKVIPVTVTSSDHNKELGELAGFHKDGEDEKSPCTGSFTDEMMVFSMVEDLNAFLDDYKKMGIRPIPLKAVVTPYNMKWTATQLHDELAKEHEAFERMKSDKK